MQTMAIAETISTTPCPIPFLQSTIGRQTASLIAVAKVSANSSGRFEWQSFIGNPCTVFMDEHPEQPGCRPGALI